MDGPIKVFLVNDHEIVRRGVLALLEHEADLQVIGQAANGREAVKRVAELSPDVLVMDLLMPELNGIDASRQILATHPRLKIIALSAVNDERTMQEMLRAGVVGFVPKTAAFEELTTAIRTVMKGKVYFDPSVIARFANGDGREAAQKNGPYNVLSPREREVLQLIAEGRSTKEIAHQLSVSIKTAETHRRNLMEKLSIDNVADLTKYAIREGLTGV